MHFLINALCFPGHPVVYPDPCPPGYYCPEGTGLKTSYPCPAGTYMPDERAASEEDCVDCDPGMYCGDEGLDTPSGNCEGGYYCTRASASATPMNDSVSNKNSIVDYFNECCKQEFRTVDIQLLQ